MGYHVDDGMVRVDRFKSSGKWYDSHAIDMRRYYSDVLIHDAVARAILDADISTEGFFFVCLNPYHEHSHPITVFLRESQGFAEVA